MGTGLRRIDNRTRAVITTDYRYGVTLLEYDASSNLVYMGIHKDQDAATSDAYWIVKKFTYGADGVDSIEKIIGVYDDRSSLAWRA